MLGLGSGSPVYMARGSWEKHRSVKSGTRSSGKVFALHGMPRSPAVPAPPGTRCPVLGVAEWLDLPSPSVAIPVIDVPLHYLGGFPIPPYYLKLVRYTVRTTCRARVCCTSRYLTAPCCCTSSFPLPMAVRYTLPVLSRSLSPDLVPAPVANLIPLSARLLASAQYYRELRK